MENKIGHPAHGLNSGSFGGQAYDDGMVDRLGNKRVKKPGYPLDKPPKNKMDDVYNTKAKKSQNALMQRGMAMGDAYDVDDDSPLYDGSEKSKTNIYDKYTKLLEQLMMHPVLQSLPDVP